MSRQASWIVVRVCARCAVLLAVQLALGLTTADTRAATIYVSTAGSDANTGGPSDPLANLQTAMNLANAGDTILVRDGIYSQGPLQTNGGGVAGLPITVRAENSRAVTVNTSPGSRILRVFHSYWNFEGLVFDGQFTGNDLIRVEAGGDFFTLRDMEVVNGARDGIDLGINSTSAPAGDLLGGVTIEDSKFENLLWNDGGVRRDAHGIVAAGVREMTIRNTEVSFVSGDAFQLQDGGWDNVLVEGVDFFNAPLPEDRAGFAAGVNPGEDGIDTKQDQNIAIRGRLTVRNSQIHGWTGDPTTGFVNAAALNMKERVEVTLDGVDLFDNDIGIRARGRSGDSGAHITAQNLVFTNNERAVRYEDDVNNLQLFNNTFAATNATFLENGGGGGLGSGFSALNNLFEAAAVPAVAGDPSNLAVTASSFVNAAGGDFHLVASSPAIDAGLTIPGVLTDRDGQLRPQGSAFDVGAFEFAATGVPEPCAAGLAGIAGIAWLAFFHRKCRRRKRLCPRAEIRACGW